MSASQRRKGATYEREVAAQINAALDLAGIGRKLGQARDGGNDIDFGPFAVECKRRKTLGTVMSWMRQCVAAVATRKGDAANATPIVIARGDNGYSFVLIKLDDFLGIVHTLRGEGCIQFTRAEIEGESV